MGKRFAVTEHVEQWYSGKNKHKIGLTCALTACCLFGLSLIFTKTGVSGVSVPTLISWRFLIACTAMTILIFTGIFKVNFCGKPLRGLLEIAIFGPVIYFLAEGRGLQLTTASEGAAILATGPIVIMVLSGLILKETPTPRQAASVVVAVAGVIVIIVAKGLSAEFIPAGYLFMFLAILADAMCVILTRKHLIYSPLERVYGMAVMGAAVFTPLALYEHIAAGTLREYLLLPLTDSGFLTAVLYLGLVSSVTGFTLYAVGIRYLGPNKMASLSGITTIVTVLAGVVILKETITFLQGLGTLLVLLGAYYANTSSARTAGGGKITG
ncbi:MAG: DMT family transporter [Sporomusaceae bacterium]|nr:DMT family transporter [Sporomusaceae bacterium]